MISFFISSIVIIIMNYYKWSYSKILESDSWIRSSPAGEYVELQAQEPKPLWLTNTVGYCHDQSYLFSSLN